MSFEQVGGVEYLVRLAQEDPKTFVPLLIKTVPPQIRKSEPVVEMVHFEDRLPKSPGKYSRHLTAKKEAHTGASFRQGHHSIPDSHSERLQTLLANF
jgi:hypothetical protein